MFTALSLSLRVDYGKPPSMAWNKSLYHRETWLGKGFEKWPFSNANQEFPLRVLVSFSFFPKPPVLLLIQTLFNHVGPVEIGCSVGGVPGQPSSTKRH